MDLFKKLNILHFYRKIKEKSIYLSDRLDFFVVLALAILVFLLTPLIINISVVPKIIEKPVNLFLSERFKEFFGKEMTEILLLEFEESAPGFYMQLFTTEAASAAARGRGSPAEADLLIFDDCGFNSLAADASLMRLNSFTNYESGSAQFAIPLVSFMNMLFYNIDLLSSAGFDRPPKTREEFIAYAKRFSGADFPGVTGAAFPLNKDDSQLLSRDFFSWIWAAGGDFWQEENGPFLNTRAVAADLLFFDNLYREGIIARDTEGAPEKRRIEEFARGREAMIIASTRAIPYLREQMGDGAFGITTIPSPGTGRYGIETPAVYAGINSACAHPEKAWSFLKFLIEKIPLLCAELKAVPGAVMQLIPGDYVKDDPYYSKAWDIFDSSQLVRGFTGNPGAAEYEAAFLEELQIYFETSRTAQQAAAAIQDRWDAITNPDKGNEE